MPRPKGHGRGVQSCEEPHGSKPRHTSRPRQIAMKMRKQMKKWRLRITRSSIASLRCARCGCPAFFMYVVAHAAAPHYVQAGGSGAGPYSTVGRMYGGSAWQEPALPGLIRSGDALGWPDNRRRELRAPPTAVLPVSPCHHRLRQVGRAELKPCSEPRVIQCVYSGSATACFLTNRYTGKTGVNDSMAFSRPAVT